MSEWVCEFVYMYCMRIYFLLCVFVCVCVIYWVCECEIDHTEIEGLK